MVVNTLKKKLSHPYKSCLCTFWQCHPYFILQFYSIVFIFVSVLFFIALSVVHQCHPTWFAHWTLNGPSIEDGRYQSSRVRANFVATSLTFLCLTKKTLRFGEEILSFVGSLSYHFSDYLCHWGTELADCWGATPETAAPRATIYLRSIRRTTRAVRTSLATRAIEGYG